MIRSLWIARTGLDAQQTQLDVISNNLANVSTNGFKRGRAVFEDLLYQTLRQPGAQSSQQTQIPSGLQLGTGVRPVSTARIFTQGNIQKTDNSLDVAVQGNGFFQVLLPDGTTGYTRDGSFQKDNQGQIVTADGYPVQPNITIPANALTVSIGTDGTVSITQSGTAATTQIGSIQLATFINQVPNHISITGHTDTTQYASSRDYTNWELSAGRANAARRALVAGGMHEDKVSRVVGLSSSVLFDKQNPQNPINRRISIVVMTKAAEDALQGEGRLLSPGAPLPDADTAMPQAPVQADASSAPVASAPDPGHP